jgi:FSR family fosmidomycin resistance protein-like MFS transporter
MIGVLASIPLLIQAVSTIPAGLLADRVDRFQMIAVSLIVSALGGILMSQVDRFALFIVFISFFSLSAGLLHPPALSTVGELVSRKTRGKALGFFGSAGTLGIALGPISLSFLITFIGWRHVYLMWSVPALLLIPLVLLHKFEKPSKVKEEQRENRGSTELMAILGNSGLVLLLAILAARAVSGTALNTYITPYFVDEWKLAPATASLIFGLRPLVGIFAAPFGGVMADKIGERRWIAVGLVSQIVTLLVMAFSNSLPWIILAYVSYAFFGLMEMPAVQALITRLIPTGGRGLAFSLSLLPHTLTGAFSPILAAHVVEAWGISSIFLFALMVLFVATALLKFLWKRTT